MATTKIIQEIPQAQKDIITQAIVNLQRNLEILSDLNNENMTISHLQHDLKTLKSLMFYKINVELTQKEFDQFTMTNGIDFPEYSI